MAQSETTYFHLSASSFADFSCKYTIFCRYRQAFCCFSNDHFTSVHENPLTILGSKRFVPSLGMSCSQPGKKVFPRWEHSFRYGLPLSHNKARLLLKKAPSLPSTGRKPFKYGLCWSFISPVIPPKSLPSSLPLSLPSKCSMKIQ